METAILATWTIQDQNIPIPVALSLLIALLIESAAFLATGSAKVRARLAECPQARLAAALTLLAGLTWLIAGGGSLAQGLGVLAVTATLAFWYIVLPRNNAVDVLLLAVYGAVALGKLSTALYPAPWVKAPANFVGELAWLRTLIFATLLFRKPDGIGYGFLPTKSEWAAGIRQFLYFLPFALVLAWAIDFARPRTLGEPWRVALNVVGNFLGHFLFVALREEFLFRGMLLPRLQQWTGALPGLAITCMAFGIVHLPMRPAPNWKFVAMATVAGWFYAKAYLATGSIRSAMVTHALTNVVARVFLTS